jgi:hypothetical protein
MAALICALASAAVALFLGDKVHARFGGVTALEKPATRGNLGD